MRNIVFDTSVAIKWFFPEKGKNKADDLKKSHLQGKISLCTRDLFLYEFTSAFKNYKSVKHSSSLWFGKAHHPEPVEGRSRHLPKQGSGVRNPEPYSGSWVRIEEKDFLLAISALRFLKLKIYPLEYDELKEIFSISVRLQISIYDASFLLLAKKLKVPLYTADKKLYQKGKGFISVFFV